MTEVENVAPRFEFEAPGYSEGGAEGVGGSEH